MKTEHGHEIIEIIGHGFSGAEEIKYLEAKGCEMNWILDSHVEQLLDEKKYWGSPEEYNKKHRLTEGKKYKIVLVLGSEIENNSDRSTENIQELAKKCGYGKPLAGVIPRICEMMLEKWMCELMKELKISSVIAFHDPIKDIYYHQHLLWTVHSSKPYLDDLEFYGSFSDHYWGRGYAFAFLV